jgi:hypothetical protein
MKNPTLADLCIAVAHDKRTRKEVRDLLLLVNDSRKFVLDKNMSSYWADLSINLCHGEYHDRIRTLENARQLARLPHKQIFIECDWSSYCNRLVVEYGHIKANDKNRLEPSRVGWLLRQHPEIETAFIATEIVENETWTGNGRASPHSISIAWCSNDLSLPWKSISFLENKHASESSWIAMVPNYNSTQVIWTSTYTEKLSIEYINRTRLEYSTLGINQTLIKPMLPIRTLWAFLAAFNDLPVIFESIVPSKKYFKYGSFINYVSHVVLHLNMPETRYRKFAWETTNILQRRAHEVRGHWRNNWRRPLVPLCEHEFNTNMVCLHCHGHKMWIPEHIRYGERDAEVVKHDYQIHHNQE